MGKICIAALDPLPVEALRLPDEIVLELRRLGLVTIAALRKIPRPFVERAIWVYPSRGASIKRFIKRKIR